jgi:hypothetical protein
MCPAFDLCLRGRCHESRENVLFIGTQFSNLYTAVDTPAEAARCIVDMSPLTIVREH